MPHDKCYIIFTIRTTLKLPGHLFKKQAYNNVQNNDGDNNQTSLNNHGGQKNILSIWGKINNAHISGVVANNCVIQFSVPIIEGFV